MVVVVGAAARDVTAEDPRGWRLGGGVMYCALTLARLGIPTAALVGVDGPSSQADELGLLRSAGADVRLVPLEHGPVFENIEDPGGRIQTCLDAGSAVPPEALPSSWSAAPWWILAPVAGEVPEAWAGVPARGAHLAIGWQGLLRLLHPGRQVARLRPRPSALLDRAELVSVSRHDVDHHLRLTEVLGPLRAGAELVMTAGDQGGLVVTVGADRQVEQLRRYPALRSLHEVDPTGAGDTFLAALVAARIATAMAGRALPPGQGLHLAAAAASLVVEDVGLRGVPGRQAVACRLAGSG